MGGVGKRPASQGGIGDAARGPSESSGPGKRTLTEQLPYVGRPARDGGAPSSSNLLRPNADAPAPPRTLILPDANHPARRDADGEQVIQTGEASGPGQPTPLAGKAWRSLASATETVVIADSSGDNLELATSYRLESRPAELGEVPETWIHTERKALLTIGTGEHAGATIVGQARIKLAPGEAVDPKAAVSKPSVGAHHWAQIYLAEAAQHVSVFGPDGQASLLADAGAHDVLAYGDPLRMLVGLRNVLEQHQVAGHGAAVADMHARAQRLLADAQRGRALLEREIESIRTHHDPHPGQVATVRFLVGDIATWLGENQQADRAETEDVRQLRQAHGELTRLSDAAAHTRAPSRDPVVDAVSAPGRFVERTVEGLVEVGAMAVDAVVLGVDALGQATGVGTFDYHPVSKYGKSIEASGASTTTALVTMVNGFADQWSDALERARHGDYRGLTDVSVDTLLLIDSAHAGGTIALAKAEALAGRLGTVARSARTLATELTTGLTAEARSIAAAMADGADAFANGLRSGGMQMSTAGAGGGGGPGGPGPKLGGISAETLAEAARAAKDAFKGRRAGSSASQEAAPAGENSGSSAPPVARSAAGNAETNATKKYQFEPAERDAVKSRVRTAAEQAATKAYDDALRSGENPSQANTRANKVAKDIAEELAKSEAEAASEARARHAVERGETLDVSKLDSTAGSQLSDFDAGKTGVESKRLAKELTGLNEREFLVKMASEPCDAKSVAIDGPPPQAMRVYEYPDGTVVRYKPAGDMKRPAPTYSVEVKKNPSLPDMGKDDAAFKVSSSGSAIPKGPFELKNPYPKGSIQALRFEREVMNAGHRTLKRGNDGR